MASKFVYGLTDFRIRYSAIETQKVNSFLQIYFRKKGINEIQLSKYDADGYHRKPIITETKCPISGNIIRKFYFIHHCVDSCYHRHFRCKLVSLKTLKSYSIGIEDKYWSLFIHVKDNMKDFETVRKGLEYKYELKLSDKKTLLEHKKLL